MAVTCIFCKIVAGEAPASRILETPECLAFLDLYPAAPGHSLVIPKAHSRDVLEMPPALAGKVMEAGHRVAAAVVKATGAAGFNFHMATHAAAGQTVFHTHLHVIPRHEQGEMMLGWMPGAYPDGGMKAMQQKIATVLQSMA